MQNILPQQAGLTVGNVIYRYTAVKNIEDDMLVHVQNEDALGDGYIFRETDDWSGLEGNKIYKIIPTDETDTDINDIYIGSTILSLTEEMEQQE